VERASPEPLASAVALAQALPLAEPLAQALPDDHDDEDAEARTAPFGVGINPPALLRSS